MIWNTNPLGYNQDGEPVFLRDIWPSEGEIEHAVREGVEPAMFKRRYANVEGRKSYLETNIFALAELQYNWHHPSTYIQDPPYFEGFN